VPHTAAKLTRAREAFIYGVRRRSLRMAQLLGAAPEQSHACLQRALSAFIGEYRNLPPNDWPERWWQLLLEQIGAGFEGAAFDPTSRREPWQIAWDRMPAAQRAAFLLHAWLKLAEPQSAKALSLDLPDFRRSLAMASLRLRQEAGVASADPRWLERLCDAFDHAALTPAEASATSAAPMPAPRQTRRSWAVPVLGLLAGLLIGAGAFLLIPDREALPTDISLPEGASGLARRSPAASALPQDLAMLLDQDWQLWAEPETAVLIKELEFHVWRESGDAD